MSPDEILEALDEFCLIGDERRPKPSRPFSLTSAQADQCFQITSELREAVIRTDWPTDGYIPVSFEGCTFYTMLVTAGKLTGTVWSCMVDVGLDPKAENDPKVKKLIEALKWAKRGT